MTPGDIYDAAAVDKAVEACAGDRPAGLSVRRPCVRTPSATPSTLLDLVFTSTRVRTVYRADRGPRQQFHAGQRDPPRIRHPRGRCLQPLLVDRAEHRLKALGLFKSVKISTETGSSRDRVVLDVDVEEEQTGDFGISGGYSTTTAPWRRSPFPNGTSWVSGCS